MTHSFKAILLISSRFKIDSSFCNLSSAHLIYVGPFQCIRIKFHAFSTESSSPHLAYVRFSASNTRAVVVFTQTTVLHYNILDRHILLFAFVFQDISRVGKKIEIS